MTTNTDNEEKLEKTSPEMSDSSDNTIEEIVSEIDIPPTNYTSQKEPKQRRLTEENVSDKLTKTLEQQIQYANRMERHIYKRQGFLLRIGCLIAYGFLVIFDTLVPTFGFQISKLSDGFVELLKFIVSTLIGFVFSENLKNDKDR